jgi:hypothetical protein
MRQHVVQPGVRFLWTTSVMLAGLAGCATTREHADGQRPAEQQQFWRALEQHCGQAFEGRVVEDSTASPDFARTPLIMHVRSCDDARILVPFHIADDRSRTWVFTTTPDGLRLKHDHRHADGTEDHITQYGGDTRGPGTPTTQEFFADAHTAGLIPAASTNVWTVEIEPGVRFAYALRREGTDRRFRVEFDLSRPVTPPPAAWGWGHD